MEKGCTNRLNFPARRFEWVSGRAEFRNAGRGAVEFLLRYCPRQGASPGNWGEKASTNRGINSSILPGMLKPEACR